MFSADDLGDLFTLGDDGALDGFTDTVDLFQVRGYNGTTSRHLRKPNLLLVVAVYLTCGTSEDAASIGQ